MIDPHAHLRDWEQAEKETLAHGLGVARAQGIDAVFEMPNTTPPLTSRAAVERRLAEAGAIAGRLGIVHGLYVGLTADPDQVREAVAIHARHYPRVVGMKLYAGHSTGRMGVLEVASQRGIYDALSKLGYRGVVAVHAEKESLLTVWDPARPSSHARARPPAAETESVRDQIRLAAEAGFQGVLHLAHVSVPETLRIAREARERSPGFRITTAVTPHHVLLCAEDMDTSEGYLLKVNPPLRGRDMQVELRDALLGGEVDWIETDHAPHTLRDKTEGHASGIPVFPFYGRFLTYLRARGLDGTRLDALTHTNIERAFGFEVPRGEPTVPTPEPSPYPFDPFARLGPGFGT